MAWQFEHDRPIYTQLLEQIRMLIISGVYPTGSRLPSVRDLAAEAAVNPNTMQKALSELERPYLFTTNIWAIYHGGCGDDTDIKRRYCKRKD